MSNVGMGHPMSHPSSVSHENAGDAAARTRADTIVAAASHRSL